MPQQPPTTLAHAVPYLQRLLLPLPLLFRKLPQLSAHLAPLSTLPGLQLQQLPAAAATSLKYRSMF